MIRAMIDTDTPLQLPVAAEILATYADLADAPMLVHLRQIHGQVVLIDRGLGDPAHLATILDVEAHAQGPAAAPAWYDARHKAGASMLTVYANRSTMPQVDTEMGHRSFYRWVARLDGIATVPGFTPGIAPAAVQIMGAAALGFHADLSLVLQPGWNPAPKLANLAAVNLGVVHARQGIDEALAALAKAQ